MYNIYIHTCLLSIKAKTRCTPLQYIHVYVYMSLRYRLVVASIGYTAAGNWYTLTFMVLKKKNYYNVQDTFEKKNWIFV